MDKLVKKKKIISLCICFTIVFTFLCSCTYANDTRTNNMKKNISSKLFTVSDDVDNLLQDNGLYCELVKGDLYSKLFWTYHSLKTLKEIEWFSIDYGSLQKDPLFKVIISVLRLLRSIAILKW